MKRFASVTFEAVLAARERGDAARSLRSGGACVTSWNEAAGRTYAFVELRPSADLGTDVEAAGVRARFDEPPLVVLRVTPRNAASLALLERTLAGPGCPRGIVDARLEPGALVVAFDARSTRLELIVALIDATLARECGRTIEALLPLDDATLASFAGALLGEPTLDATRLIETYLEPLLAPLDPA